MASKAKAAAKKIGSTVKKAAKETVKTAEGAAKFAVNPIGEGSAILAEAVTGKKAGAVFNPLGTGAGEIGEKLVDKPKAAAEAAKVANVEAETRMKKTIDDVKAKKEQEEAESEASTNLNRAVASQRKRRGGKGRSSTILTGSLGGAGGENNQGRKSLLGL